MRRRSLKVRVQLFVMILGSLLISGCSGGGGDKNSDGGISEAGGNCVICPNQGKGGVGLTGESCASSLNCTCGLTCIKNVCTPYTGTYKGCSCKTYCSGSVAANYCDKIKGCNLMTSGMTVKTCTDAIDKAWSLLTTAKRTDCEAATKKCTDQPDCANFVNCVATSPSGC